MLDVRSEGQRGHVPRGVVVDGNREEHRVVRVCHRVVGEDELIETRVFGPAGVVRIAGIVGVKKIIVIEINVDLVTPRQQRAAATVTIDRLRHHGDDLGAQVKFKVPKQINPVVECFAQTVRQRCRTGPDNLDPVSIVGQRFGKPDDHFILSVRVNANVAGGNGHSTRSTQHERRRDGWGDDRRRVTGGNGGNDQGGGIRVGLDRVDQYLRRRRVGGIQINGDRFANNGDRRATRITMITFCHVDRDSVSSGAHTYCGEFHRNGASGVEIGRDRCSVIAAPSDVDSIVQRRRIDHLPGTEFKRQSTGRFVSHVAIGYEIAHIDANVDQRRRGQQRPVLQQFHWRLGRGLQSATALAKTFCELKTSSN